MTDTKMAIKKRVNNIKVVKNPIEPETPEVLAASIISIADSMKKLSGVGGLTHDAIAALIINMRGNSRLSKEDILLVLEGLGRLKSYYIRVI